MVNRDLARVVTCRKLIEVVAYHEYSWHVLNWQYQRLYVYCIILSLPEKRLEYTVKSLWIKRLLQDTFSVLYFVV
jgi:hypothetical protein